MKLQRLAYVSKSVRRVTIPLIARILASATRRNRQLDVTGLLVSNDDKFLQILEGPPKSIAALAGKIFSDPRHGEYQVLDFEWTSHRLFPQWSMEGVYLNEWPEEVREDLIARYGRDRKGVMIPDDPHAALELLFEIESFFRDETVPAELAISGR